MKVTAILPDELVSDVRRYSEGKNITESLLIALNEWLSLRKIKALNTQVEKAPLEFNQQFSAEIARATNRKP